MIEWFERHNRISWVFTVLIGIVIFCVSSINLGYGGGLGYGFNSILYHILAFFGFSFFLFLSLVKGERKRYKFFIFGFVLAFLYAVLDELHQFFVPGRFCSAGDVLLDFIGIFIAFFVYFLFLKFRS